MTRLTVAMVAGILLFAAQVSLAQEEGTYQIKSRHSGKVLAFDEGQTKIIQDTAKKEGIQEWKLVKSGDYFKLVELRSGKVVTANKADKGKEWALATLEKDSGGQNQEWSLDSVKTKDSTFYVFKSRSDGLVLHVLGGDTNPGAAIITYKLEAKAGSAHQQWQLIPRK